LEQPKPERRKEVEAKPASAKQQPARQNTFEALEKLVEHGSESDGGAGSASNED
jgi:hypothetical protein